jgi:putative glycosyltransferase (TIGR04348 family)
VRIAIVCPAPSGSRLGNRVTAVRWRTLLSELGHEVHVTTETPQRPYDVLVALHAYKTAEAVRWSRARHAGRPIVVALTGTDLYRDIHVRPEARRSLQLADRLVVLHDRASKELPRDVRGKVRLIRQSAEHQRPAAPARKRAGLDVAFVAHLRDEKDPLRAALASRLLPEASRVRIVHAGRALDDAWARRALAEQAENRRYVWLGEVSPRRARGLIAGSQALVLTSLVEGGANVLGEAIVAGTPVLSTRIPAAVSALGSGYTGFFPVGETAALARLLRRFEEDRVFRVELRRRVRSRRPLFRERAEKAAWRSLLAELTGRVR